jgi:hypothetical protein
MNEVQRTPPQTELDPEEMPSRGPSLTLFYSLIVLAMLAAIAIAAFIVLPFYHRH